MGQERGNGEDDGRDGEKEEDDKLAKRTRDKNDTVTGWKWGSEEEAQMERKQRWGNGKGEGGEVGGGVYLGQALTGVVLEVLSNEVMIIVQQTAYRNFSQRMSAKCITGMDEIS